VSGWNEGLLYDAERDLLAIAEFIIIRTMTDRGRFIGRLTPSTPSSVTAVLRLLSNKHI